MNRSVNMPAAGLPGRKFSTGLKLALVAVGLAFLAACGSNTIAPISINGFTAQPLEQGDGTWRLSWDVTGTDAVTVNAVPYSGGVASINVTPTTATEYVLRAGNQQAAVTIAPVTQVQLDLDQEIVYTGQVLQLNAAVAATGSDRDPAQGVDWTSSDSSVLLVTGRQAEAVGHGSVTLTATSRQDSSVSTSLDLTVEQPLPAAITSFSIKSDAETLEAGTEVLLEWTVTNAATVEIVEVVTGGVDRTVFTDLDPTQGSLSLALPTDKAEVNYRLQANNVVGDQVSQLLLEQPQQLPGWICQDPGDVITIEDPSLEAAVWRIYANTDLDPGDGILRCGMVQQDYFTAMPTESDDYGLMELHNAIVINRCNQSEDPVVTTLEGIQHLSTLLRLELMCNGIDDISRLNGLTSLQELNLDVNRVSDVSALAGLTELVVLGLYQNEVEDVTPLAGLTNLRILYLSENRIHDVSPLAGLVNLEHLWLLMNCRNLDGGRPSDCLQDVSSLGGLPQLESLLIQVNEIGSIDFLNSGMESLQLLFASHNRISDLTALTDLPLLSTVRLDTNLVGSITPLADNTALPSTEGPYHWQRIDPGTNEWPGNVVTVPGNFQTHISLHENCLDIASDAYLADLATLAERGALVEGSTDWQMSQPACTGGLSSLSADPVHFDPAGVLRQDSRWYRNRQ